MRNTTLCYLEQDGRYLMLHRVKKQKDLNRDKWIGIGGKFERGESPEECLLREVHEETGLCLTRWRFRGIVTFVGSPGEEAEYMHLFTADAFTGTQCDCDEGELEWVEKARVAQLPVWEGDRLFLRLLAEDAPVFLLTLRYDGDHLVYAALNGEALPLP